MTKTCEPHDLPMQLRKPDRLGVGLRWMCASGCQEKPEPGDLPDAPDPRLSLR
ncbi:hypothetical protein [Agrococcus jejuensis]|nr:hypothetical protein [Agrococcus jejuensis]